MKETIYVKSKKKLLSFEMWISRNGQPDRDEDLDFFVVMTLT